MSGEADAFRGAGALVDASRAAVGLVVMQPEQADKLNIPSNQRRRYLRAENAKLNLALPPDDGTWLYLESVEIGTGDHIQAARRWYPPSPWDGVNWDIIRRVLERIEAGPSAGEFFTLARTGKDKTRWAGVAFEGIIVRSEVQRVTIMRQWHEAGVLETGVYMSPGQRRERTCVRVNAVKVSEFRRQKGDEFGATINEPE